jgi:type IV pilus assembly protein PilE
MKPNFPQKYGCTMTSKYSKGFTLLELMIVVVIIAILASFAYFNYANYAFRSRRSEGQQFVLAVASAEERYLTALNKYTTDVTGAAPTGLSFSSATSQNGYYSVVVTVAAGDPNYTITASPALAQANDKCGQLVINNFGVKTAIPGTATNGSCW